MTLRELYSENCTTFMKEIGDVVKERKDISYGLGLEELMVLKYLYFPKQSTDIMQSLSEYP